MAANKHAVTGDQYRDIDRRMNEIKRQLNQEGGSPLEPEAVKDALQEIIEGNFGGKRTLAQMIAAGRYDYVNPDITEEHFPVLSRNRDEYDLEPVHYGKPMSSEAVLKDFAEKGLEPADIADLCEYGEKNPEEQRKHPVVELGSVWQHPRGRRGVAALGGDDSERPLFLYYVGNDWPDSCRFLARRKSARGG